MVIKVTRLAGANAVLSGLFFGPPTNPATATTVSFIGRTPRRRATGSGPTAPQGYNVIGDTASYPSYATVTPAGQSTKPGPRARPTRRPPESRRHRPDRRVLVLHPSFTVDVNLTDGQAHDVSLYALDWD